MAIAMHYDPIVPYFVFGFGETQEDAEQHLSAHINAGYHTVYRGSCTGGFIEEDHYCQNYEYHKHYCFNHFQPCDGHDWPVGTGDHTANNGKAVGHVNDRYKDSEKWPSVRFIARG